MKSQGVGQVVSGRKLAGIYSDVVLSPSSIRRSNPDRLIVEMTEVERERMFDEWMVLILHNGREH